MNPRAIRCAFIFFAALGCGRNPDNIDRFNNAYALLEDDPEPGLPLALSESKFLYKEGEATPATKVFLIAGSKDGANFGQEIVEQKAYWKSLGFSEAEIACYYVIPDANNYHHDRGQYDALIDELKDCYPANMKRISRDIASVAETKPKFVYIYVTSHGSDPISYAIKKTENRLLAMQLKALAKRFPFLNQYTIALDALAKETGSLLKALQDVEAGAPYEDVFFTAGSFMKTLAQLPAETKKYVILQACHSGGFIEEDAPEFLEATLRDQPNLTALAAARHDRTSFGCNVDADYTYYGEVFNTVLSKTKRLPTDVDWLQVHDEVSVLIEEKEHELAGEKILPSIPQYFSNMQ